MSGAIEFNYDEIVIGADLDAVAYAYMNKVPLIYTRQLRPYINGFLKNVDELNDMYNYLIFNISFNSLCPFADKIQYIRIEDDYVKVTTKSNYLFKIKVKRVKLSDDYKVEGLPEKIGKTSYDNCVIDHLGVDERVKLDTLSTREERVLRKIYFPNKYVKKVRLKQLITTSIISDDELKDVAFSEAYMRLRLRRIYEPKIVEFYHLKREVHSLGKNLYAEDPYISMITQNYQEILEGEQIIDKNFSIIEEKLWNKLKQIHQRYNIWQE